jgi:hypothetical protein
VQAIVFRASQHLQSATPAWLHECQQAGIRARPSSSRCIAPPVVRCGQGPDRGHAERFDAGAGWPAAPSSSRPTGSEASGEYGGAQRPASRRYHVHGLNAVAPDRTQLRVRLSIHQQTTWHGAGQDLSKAEKRQGQQTLGVAIWRSGSPPYLGSRVFRCVRYVLSLQADLELQGRDRPLTFG